MKKIVLQSIAMAVLFVGCAKDEVGTPEMIVTDAPEMITAAFEPMTKVHLNGLNAVWNTNDAISVYAKTNAQNRYVLREFKEGTGNKIASFKFDMTYNEATTVLDKNYAIFPSREADNTASNEGVLTTAIVHNQTYDKGRHLMNAPMVAVSDDYEFEFNNVASIIRFNVKKSADFTEKCVLNSIQLNSKSAELCGVVTIDTRKETWAAVVSSRGNHTTMLKGSSESGINTELTTVSQAFCLVIPAGKYPANDLTITLTYNTSESKAIVYPSELVVGANKVQDINCTLKPAAQSGIVVTTGGIFEFNGHPHLTLHTASVTGGVSGSQDGVTVEEMGVLYKRNGSEADLVYGKVPENPSTNDLKMIAATEVSETSVIKMTDLVGSGDGATRYAYRYYARLSNGDVKYGATKEFKTDVPGFVQVKAGSFTMGANSGQHGYHKDRRTAPAHTVVLSKDFEISKYEVTIVEFLEFLNDYEGITIGSNNSSYVQAKHNGVIVYNGAANKTEGSEESFSLKYENGNWSTPTRKKFPMERVSWYGAVQYCKWLTEKKNDGYEYRLPTEAEWEYAARGGNQSRNYKYSGSNTLAEVGAWKSGKSGWHSIQRGGEFYPNELGIYDMSGNLWEFVSDRGDENWTPSNVASLAEPQGYFAWCGTSITDPAGPTGQDGTFTGDTIYHIQKGGCANDGESNAGFCPGYRQNNRKDDTFTHACGGFRIVRVKK